VKIARTVGLAALAALAMMASLGPGSASAADTALCIGGNISPFCENPFPEGTSLETSSSNATFETGLGNIKCGKSTLNGKTAASTGDPLPIDFSAWTFTGGCALGGTGCTATPGSGPYDGTLAWTDHSNGSLLLANGGSGGPSVYFKCGFFINCTFSAEPTLDVNGGEPMTIVAAQEPLSASGTFCPSSPKFSATYTASSPTVAFVGRTDIPATPTTALCKVSVLKWCEQADLYPAGTKIAAVSTNLVIKNGKNTLLSCKSTTLEAETAETQGEPLLFANNMKIIPKECSAYGVPLHACTVNPGSPVGATLTRLENSWNGSWKIGKITWTAACGSTFPCSFFTIPNGSAITLEGQHPAAVKMNLTIEGTKSEICGENPSLTADFTVTSPDPLLVTDVVPAT
jgi:hypothetical protein